MKKLLVPCCLLITTICIAQQEKHAFKGSERKLAVFMNTFSMLEPQQGAIGAGINYKIVRRWDVSLELNYLFEGFAQSTDNYNSKGYRAILTGKRFSRNGIFFYGIDTRLKHFSYVDKQDFVNIATSDTLFSLSHNANTSIIGGAGIAGLRLPISKNKRWAFEINTGIGAKYRYVQRKNIPAGYKHYHNIEQDSRHYNITNNQDVDGVEPYFPSAIRIMYFF